MDLAGKYLLYLYVALVPLMKIPKLSFMGDKLQYCDLIFVPLFIIFTIKAVKGKSEMIRDKIFVFIIILAFVSVLSLFSSPYKNEVYLDTLGLLYLLAVYFVITNLMMGRKTLLGVNSILSISGALISLLGIIFFISYNFFNMRWLAPFMYAKVSDTQTALLPFRRSASLLTLPEMFVNFGLLGLACLFILQNKQHKKAARSIVNLLIVIVILAAFLAFGRSLIGMMLLCSALAFRARKRSPISYCIFIICVSIFSFLFLSAAILWFYTIVPASFSIDASGMARLSFNARWDTRYYLAKAGLIMGSRHPWLGSGLGSFTNHFSTFLSQEDLSALASRRGEPIDSMRIDPHSLYFGAIAEIGWVGLFLLLSFFLCIIARLGKRIRTEYACYVFFFAVLGYLINGLFVDVMSMRSLWLVLSLGTSFVHLSGEGQERR